MASLGSDVQSTSIELVSIIEDMKDRSAVLEKQINKENEEKARLLADIKALQNRLETVELSLQRKVEAKGQLDAAISETFTAFKGIVDASKDLLRNAQEGSNDLRRKTAC